MARATRDPSANSHSRARVSKYANACWVCVVITENASETAKTAPKHTASTGTLLRPVRRLTSHASAKINGQTRNT